MERIDSVLHGLCQPLTVLQCRLALGELSGEAVDMREAIEAALQECVRLNASVGAMREMLQQAMKAEES
jgi:cytochrome P450